MTTQNLLREFLVLAGVGAAYWLLTRIFWKKAERPNFWGVVVFVGLFLLFKSILKLV